MSLKTLIFGETDRIKKILQVVNPSQPSENDSGDEEAIRVENLTIDEKNFLIFALSDRSLISQQAVGSNALIFFLDHEKPLYEEKQFLLDILNSKRQFDTIPLVVLFDKEQGLNIKEVINYLELFKMKDRTSMIKEINFTENITVKEVFKWINTQHTNIQMRSSRSFDAHPKVIKMKPKYRESEEDSSLKKYEGILKDKEIRGKDVRDQETAYIVQEKERIKNQNMERQLANFNKNKKKMTPYDIKATPNPKIEANLHFFLKDPKSQKDPQVNIKIQTDEFKPRPPEKPYVPKKTGINISTQIEQNELFDFDKEVKPILNILTIKALENAALQIEEEEEFARIQKYKAAYNDRVKRQKEHEKKKIEDELTLIKKKEKLLQETRKKHSDKRNIKKRLICYDMSNKFLQDIYKKANLQVYNKNQYFDAYENEIRTEYLQHLMDGTAQQLKKLGEKSEAIMGVFDRDCVDPILKKSQQPKQEREELRKQSEKRRINESLQRRIVHILYKYEEQKYSSFSKYIEKNFDGTLEDFVQAKEQEYQDVSDKISNGDLPEEELNKIKNGENLEFSKSHETFTIDSEQPISFSITPNRYERASNDLMDIGFVLLDKEGEVTNYDFIDKSSESKLSEQYPFLKRVTNIRSNRKVVNMDESVIFDLKKLSPNVKSVLLLTRFNQVQKYLDEQKSKQVKNSSYGLQFSEKNIPIHKENITEKISWADIVKPVENEDGEAPSSQEKPQESLMNVTYLISRKGEDNWKIEHVRYIHKKTISNQEQKENFIEELSKFYTKSLEIFKEDDEEEAQPTGKKTTSRKQRRGARSRKVIEEAKEQKPSFRVTSRILPELEVNLHDSLEKVQAQLSDHVKEWRQFIEHCGEPGWELLVKGKKLESVEQLRAAKKVGDVRIVKLQPIVEEQKKENDGEEGQEQEADADEN